MALEKRLGKIQDIKFGMGGYQDAQIGVTLTICGGKDSCWAVGSFDGFWVIERSERCKWTEIQRRESLGDTVMRIKDWLEQAGISDLAALQGKPVEATFEGSMLKSWRLLTEVL